MHIDGRAGNLRRCAVISEPGSRRFTLLILFRRRTGELSKLRPDVWSSRQVLWILKKYWKPFGFLRERLFVFFRLLFILLMIGLLSDTSGTTVGVVQLSLTYIIFNATGRAFDSLEED